MPSMRNSAGASASRSAFMFGIRRKRRERAAPAALAFSETVRSLVLFRLPHDLLRGEIDPAGREIVADEEVVGLVGIVVNAILELGVLDDGQRQLDRLRNDLALERVDGRLDRDGNLSGAGAGGGA